MSRTLPSPANLEFLRKEAKTRLRHMQGQAPEAQLADAQHRLAKEYGFASWPRLVAHVQGHIPIATMTMAGRWRANLAASQQHPDNPVQSAVIEIAIEGNAVTVRDHVVDAAGREERRVNTMQADGEEHQHPNVPGMAMVHAWEGDRVLIASVTRDGTLAGWGRYELSDDGRQLTVVADRMRIVFDRIG